MLSFSEIFSLLKASNWIKNIVILLPAFFGLTIIKGELILPLILGFLGFSFLSSSIYIVNDIFDKEVDQVDPEKKNRPIASGKIGIKTAASVSFFLLIIALLLALYLGGYIVIYFIAYLLVNLLYSWRLKQIGVVDVLCIGSGFIFRIMVGANIAGVYASSWILALTFATAIFFPLIKRKNKSKQSINPYPFYEKVNFKKFMSFYGVGIVLLYMGFCLYQVYIKEKTEVLFLSIIPVGVAIFEFIRKSTFLSVINDPVKDSLKNPAILIGLATWVIIMTFSYY